MVFSTFNRIDLDNDVTLPEAMTDGQETLMVWAHDWTNPIGKGVIRIEQGRARFDGQFWHDTMAGEGAYKRVKNAGSLQEYSYGYRVLDSEPGSFQGKRVRFLKKLEVFEVSPVLKGAAGTGNSYSLSVKQGQRHQLTPAEVAEIAAIRRSVDTGALFEMEKARALGVALKQPSQYHLLMPDQQLQIELIKARGLGVRV